ncbi:MAG TPA: tyrosine-type recombinase/integrase, partial [Dissulfurispiraceae bacterium]|nr:tyrosine-type recombinase/integrase [Dissulfurispiraceae bacterium]
ILLKRHSEGAEELIFRTKTGSQYNGMNVYHAFQRACTAAGITKRKVHDLRHTTGTRLGDLGFKAHQIAAILDHSQLSTTLRYIKTDLDAKRQIMSNFGVISGQNSTENLTPTCNQLAI